MAAEEGLSSKEIYERIAVKDVQLAADVMRPVWDETGGDDGFVSLEVEPDLAHDTEATIAQARDYWKRVDRPNVMIKIPGTDEGVPAIEEAIDDGININVTLLFSVEAYARVAEAYIRGLERRLEAGRVGRRALGRQLLRLARGHRGGQAARAVRQHRAPGHRRGRERARRLPALQGDLPGRAVREAARRRRRRAAPAVGVDGGQEPALPRHEVRRRARRAAHGEHDADADAARRRRAVGDHGATADQDPTDELRKLADAGIDMDDVTDKLLREGIDAFIKSLDGLLDGVEKVREAIVTGRPVTIKSSIPDDLEPAIAEKARRGEVRQRRAARLAQGRHALGRGRCARGGRPARLAHDQRSRCSRRRLTSRSGPRR